MDSARGVMEKLEVMVHNLIWEKEEMKKRGNALFCVIPLDIGLFLLAVKTQTQSAEGQWGD